MKKMSDSNHLIGVTTKSNRLIDEAYALAETIYKHDFSSVYITFGNYAGYGKYLGQYHPTTQTIEIPIGNKGCVAAITNDGIELDGNAIDLIIHELGHHYERHMPIPTFKAGHSTHTRATWCVVCAKGWSYTTGKEIRPERLAQLLKADTKMAGYMRSFHLSNVPDVDFNYETPICCNCGKELINKRADAKYCDAKCKREHNK